MDTKGPEIRTGFLAGDAKEIELKKDASIRITTDTKFEKSCTSVHLFVDYKNINKVVNIGSKIFVDDGLISLIVEKIGNFCLKFSREFLKLLFWNLNDNDWVVEL